MEGSRQIQQIVDSAVSNIKQLAETNTVVGQPVITANGSTIFPLSEVTFAFVVGGGEYPDVKNKREGQFAGGSGGGATVAPVGFLIVEEQGVKLMRFDGQSNISRIIDAAADLIKEGAKGKGKGKDKS